MIFTVYYGPGDDEQRVELQRLATGERRILAEPGRNGKFIPSGHLVYVSRGRLLAMSMDAVQLQTSSTPTAIVQNVWDWASESAAYATSDRGDLAYVAGNANPAKELVWVNRAGTAQPISAPPQTYQHPRLSPDGRQVALQILGPTEDIWIYDLARATLTRLTTEDGSAQRPLWTPDGKRMTYRVTRAGYRNIFWKPADGSAVSGGGASENRRSVNPPRPV